MSTQKQAVNQLFVFIPALWLITGFSLQAFAGEENQSKQTRLSTTQSKSELRKDSSDWIDSVFSPIIKYSPMDVVLPYNLLPDTLDSWKSFKKNMEEKYGTSIGITLLDHHQHILNGPGARKGRNIFWWNLTIKQRLSESSNLICKVRGGSGTTKGNPPNGITPLVGTKLNLDWAAYETELLYVANIYLEQRFLNDKLLIVDYHKISWQNLRM